MDEAAIMDMLLSLRAQHRALDNEITELSSSYHGDQLRLMRLKRKKLEVKEEVTRLEIMLEPDIIA
ncbi:MAG: DUF465 domain-containing protein [Alphaproteobacteria bacterium]|nr:DUF465 domain-containing protein [Alphaproteobacteria bacterium]